MALQSVDEDMSLTIKSFDQVDVLVTHSDAGIAPDAPKGGQRLNTAAVWFKVGNEEWRRSRYRSAMQTSDFIRRNKSTELVSILCEGALIDEGSKTSSGGDSSSSTSELQVEPGHSSGNADKTGAGNS